MDKLKNIFEHTDCLSEDILTKYIAGKLPPAEKHQMEKHLIDCEMCSDAVEGLNMTTSPQPSPMEREQIHSVVEELNQKIQTRISRIGTKKKEVKVIFLRQYRTQLAVAASIILVVGLVWFFKSNVSMKEMDNATAEKMFADKFEPPPADLDNETTTGKEQAEPDTKNPVASAQEPPPSPVESIAIEDAEKIVAAEESRSYSTDEGLKAGKDLADEKHLTVAKKRKHEDIPARKYEQVQQNITLKKSEEKEDQNYYWRNKNVETPKANASTASKLTTRDEDANAMQDEIAKVTVTKEPQKYELESLKEKDKKDESKKSQGTIISNTEVLVPGTSSVSANQSTDKSSSLTKKDAQLPSDDRNRADANTTQRNQGGEGDILAIESGKSSKSKGPPFDGKGKEEKYRGKSYKKAKAPQKVSGGYFDQRYTTSSPMPETGAQTKSAETKIMAGEETSGKIADSTVAFGDFESTIVIGGLVAIDSAMNKYDKQDYGGAVKFFEQTLKQNPNNEKALFYSAVSYLSLGQTEKAITNFNKILANKNSKYYDDAQWYSSLAYIKNNDLKNARTNLIQIQNNEKSRYKRQADETLEQIKK